MLTSKKFIQQSLELHLFFARIMKEHSFFLEVGFTPKDSNYMNEADALSCKIFTVNYPLLIDHILREARLYFTLVKRLQNGEEFDLQREAYEQEVFWNRIMAEHSKFIRGLLDPTVDIRKFKQQGTQGILECKIKSIIIPLLGDHTLREANHYLRLLKIFRKSSDMKC